eukprot:13526145-Alexandrium_andersonii.AAC.1
MAAALEAAWRDMKEWVKNHGATCTQGVFTVASLSMATQARSPLPRNRRMPETPAYCWAKQACPVGLESVVDLGDASGASEPSNVCRF